MIKTIKALINQGKQYIPDLTKVQLPETFRGRPIILNNDCRLDGIESICPTDAITLNPLTLDLGKCTFCGECPRKYPNKIKFTNDFKIATNDRDQLLIKEGINIPIRIVPEIVRKEIKKLFKNSLKLRQVSAGGDNSEWELNACNNVNFDLSRFGIDFVASPRHADGIVITGPITENMAEPLQQCYDAVPDPKIIILVGVDAISGGIFAGSPALDRSFLTKYRVDLFVPGNPPHPLTFINGVIDLIRK